MLKKIKIKNFQSWKDVTFELTPGVNIFTGSSNIGKTAIKRAIEWCLQNEPKGDYFRSHWGGDTEVTVDDVRRVRTASKNEYYLKDTCFKAFGNNPPSEIIDYVNMDSVNWQGQLDAPFLLSNSAGEVARYLNKTVDLEVIDESLSNINKKAFANNSEFKFETNKLEELNAQLDEFKGLKKIERKGNTLVRLNKENESVQNKIKTIQGFISSVTQISDFLRTCIDCKKAITTICTR